MKTLLRGFLIAFCTFCAILCFDALTQSGGSSRSAILASSLDLSVETVAVGAGILSTLSIVGFIATFQDESRE